MRMLFSPELGWQVVSRHSTSTRASLREPPAAGGRECFSADPAGPPWWRAGAGRHGGRPSQREGGSGAWVWSFKQNPLSAGSSIGELSGGGVVMARLLGLPFVRLRVALPEDLFPGNIGHSVGRLHGLAPKSLKAGYQQASCGWLPRRPPRSSGCQRSPRRSAASGFARPPLPPGALSRAKASSRATNRRSTSWAASWAAAPPPVFRAAPSSASPTWRSRCGCGRWGRCCRCGPSQTACLRWRRERSPAQLRRSRPYRQLPRPPYDLLRRS